MPLQFTVSPDFSPRIAPGWFVFNTWLQRTLGQPVHLELYANFEAQRQAIHEDRVDLIYANPFDASRVLLEKGFRAIAAPEQTPDETLIAVASDSSASSVKDLRPGLRVAVTDDPDVLAIGMILLEPADIGKKDVVFKKVSSYVLVAKELLSGQADLGFFLQASYRQLSAVVTDRLRPIAHSQIHVIRHALLGGPRFWPYSSSLSPALKALSDTETGRSILEGIGLSRWEILDQEDVEFMIDLVDTLLERPS